MLSSEAFTKHGLNVHGVIFDELHAQPNRDLFDVYIKPGSTFDKEAYKRSFSAYLPGRFLPMLPKSLTAKISLRAGVESPAHSVLFTIDPESGEILKTERVHTLVKINKRLDFKSVQDFIDDPAEVDWDKTTRRNMEQLVRIFRLLRDT